MTEGVDPRSTESTLSKTATDSREEWRCDKIGGRPKVSSSVIVNSTIVLQLQLYTLNKYLGEHALE